VQRARGGKVSWRKGKEGSPALLQKRIEGKKEKKIL
jgi:hypothetical protein